jgi:bilirubin oxidase
MKNKTIHAFSRRKFIKSIGLATALSAVPPLLQAKRTLTNSNNPFVIPALAQAQRNGSQLTFNLEIHKAQHQFFKGVNTPTMGINQSYLGPVLRAKRGDTVTINVKNTLQEVSTLHWHGMTLPAKMDGGPHQAIAPQKTGQSRFEIRQEAGTLWYHSHAMHQTGRQVYHGLAGLFIIDDEKSEKLALPHDYGIDDIPCTLQDRRFNQDGSFSYLTSMPDQMMGMHGSTVLVNGVVTPTLKAKRTLLRLRLHNGSNARTYQLAFSDRRPFYVIASDCGFLARPFQTTTVRLAAAERIEILVDLADKKRVTLKNIATQDSSVMGMMPMMQMMKEQVFDIMQIDARQAAVSPLKIPTTLAPNPRILDPKKSVITRRFELEMGMMGQGGMGMMRGMMGNGKGDAGMFRINGKSMDIDRIDFQVKRNTTEIWEISNASPMAHPFHVHNVQFRVLDRNGKAPHPIETGLKDVVLVQGGEKVRIIMSFPEYSDPKTPYMYHCHILEHEDQGMMGQFIVV